MTQRPQTYTSNDSYVDQGAKNNRSGSLMTGLAFGVATELANTNIQGMQISGLHPHVQNQAYRDSMIHQDQTHVLPINNSRNLNNPCIKYMNNWTSCMEKEADDFKKCQNSLIDFRECKRDNNII